MNQNEIINSKCADNPKIMDAMKTILKEIGDDPEREGLQRTPKRFARACEEWFGGYDKNPEDVLNRTFPSEGYDDLIVIPNIHFNSFCEHHIAPIRGCVHIGVIAENRIAGLDKYIKLVEIFARRLQTQEVMTQQIGQAIVEILKPKGVYILVEAKHDCVSSRETKNNLSSFMTTFRHGLFKKDLNLESRFLALINISNNKGL